MSTKSKILYIDHLRVVLTVLVILHHAAISYGAPGSWYYVQKTEELGFIFPLTLMVAVNQAFFMGFFFFLSALFIPVSFDKKGPAKFVSDRLVRLGLPLVFYSLILSPFLSYMVYYQAKGNHITYMQYLGGFDEWISFGVLWFVAALLLFTLVYVMYRLLSPGAAVKRPIPSASKIIGFALVIGLISFFARIVFPVGWTLKPFGFQLGHFPQYISMFVFGTIAARSKWLEVIDYKLGKRMALIAVLLIVIGFPALIVAQQVLDFPLEYFVSGFHWQSLWYAVWEQLVGFTVVTALLGIGRHRWDVPSRLLNSLARSTFAAYIFHPLILIALSVFLHHWQVEPALKLLIVGPGAVIGTFLLASLLVRIPGLNRVL